MVLRQGLVCRKCGYDLNSSDATKCEVCNNSLKNSSVFSNTLYEKPLELFARWGVPFFLLLFGAIAAHLVWKYVVTQSSASDTVRIEPSGQLQCTSFAPTEQRQAPHTQICPSMEAVNNVPDGQFSYSGTRDLAALYQEASKLISQAQPEFRLNYVESLFAPTDPNSVVEAVISSEASFAVTNAPLTSELYKAAASKGIQLKQIPIAVTRIVFYTNPQVDIVSLPLEQLQAIYTGKLSNWKQVRGPDLAIVPVIQTSDANVQSSFLLRGLADSQQKFSPKTVKVKNFNDALARVNSTPGAISYSSQTMVVGQQVKVLGITKGENNEIYPTTKRLYVVVRADGQLDERAGIAYANLLLSDEGQQLVEKMGYLPIR